MLSDLNCNMAIKLTAMKCQSYTMFDKLRIIQFAEQNGNHAAELEFSVSESNVSFGEKVCEPQKESCMARVGD